MRMKQFLPLSLIPYGFFGGGMTASDNEMKGQESIKMNFPLTFWINIVEMSDSFLKKEFLMVFLIFIRDKLHRSFYFPFIFLEKLAYFTF